MNRDEYALPSGLSNYWRLRTASAFFYWQYWVWWL